MMNHTVSQRMIIELAPTEITTIIPLIIMMAVVITMNFLTLFKRTNGISDTLLIVGMTVFSALVDRNYPVAYCVVAPTVAGLLAMIPFRINQWFNVTIISVSAVAITALLAQLIVTHDYSGYYIDQQRYPVDAVDYIEENIDLSAFRVINGFDYGAYLAYRHVPSFMDSRSEVFEKYYNGVTILEEFERAFINNDAQCLDDMVEKYHANYILIEKADAEQLLLDLNMRYQTVYKDDYFTLYQVKE